MTIEDYQKYSRKSEDTAIYKISRYLFILCHKVGDQPCQHRSCRDKKRDVRCRTVQKGEILTQEVECDAQKTREGKLGLITETPRPQDLGACRKKEKIGDDIPVKEYLRGRQILEKYFCRNESNAPYKYHGESQSITQHHIFSHVPTFPFLIIWLLKPDIAYDRSAGPSGILYTVFYPAS